MPPDFCYSSSISLVWWKSLVLSSALYDVKLWEALSISGGPLHSFEACKAARFSHSGTNFAALSSDKSRQEILLYDVQSYKIELRLPDSSSNHSGLVQGHAQSFIHFSPMDTMLLWNGILWDRRSSSAIHRFDQFTDYGGGGFHPAGNEVSIEYGLCEMLNSRAIGSNVAPKDEKWFPHISELEALLPAGTLDHSAESIYKEMPKWEESVVEARRRYMSVIQALADKYPDENLLLVSHD